MTASDGARPGEPTIDVPAGLALVTLRRLLEPAVVARLRLAPGDRVLVAPGAEVAAGDLLVSRLRDPSVREAGKVGRSGHVRPVRPGAPWPDADARDDAGRGADDGRRGAVSRAAQGEYLYEVGGRWRVVAGDLADPLEAPVAGHVAEVRHGTELVLETHARGLRGAEALGGPARGRLAIVAGAGGEVRASSIDVGRAGAILVVGARIDAEALTRARAMGVRGIVVAGLPSKERRDFLASEARQRASRQVLPPFAVLVLDGVMRRPIPSAAMAVLEALQGRDVGIVDDPPALVIDDSDAPIGLPMPRPDLVQIRAGALAGSEGRWAGLGGRRRFAGGVDLETGAVVLDSGEVVVVPLGDLERFG